MKTIQISDKTYEFLSKFMERINTQDNRHTAFPIYYTIQEKKKEYSRDLNIGESVFVELSDGLSEIGDVTALKKWLKDDDCDKKLDWKEIDELDDWDILDFCEKAGYEYIEEMSWQWVYPEQGFFLTEEACETHIKMNHYHYENPHSYVNHAWRHPEILSLLQAVGEVTGKGYKEH